MSDMRGAALRWSPQYSVMRWHASRVTSSGYVRTTRNQLGAEKADPGRQNTDCSWKIITIEIVFFIFYFNDLAGIQNIKSDNGHQAHLDQSLHEAGLVSIHTSVDADHHVHGSIGSDGVEAGNHSEGVVNHRGVCRDDLLDIIEEALGSIAEDGGKGS